MRHIRPVRSARTGRNEAGRRRPSGAARRCVAPCDSMRDIKECASPERQNVLVAAADIRPTRHARGRASVAPFPAVYPAHEAPSDIARRDTLQRILRGTPAWRRNSRCIQNTPNVIAGGATDIVQLTRCRAATAPTELSTRSNCSVTTGTNGSRRTRRRRSKCNRRKRPLDNAAPRPDAPAVTHSTNKPPMRKKQRCGPRALRAGASRSSFDIRLRPVRMSCASMTANAA